MRSTRMIGAAAAALALAAATPAYAADGWTVTNSQTQNGNTITQSANGRILTSDADSETILADCKVMTSPPATGTGLLQCYLLGANGARYDLANSNNFGFVGPVAMTADVFDVPKQKYRTCVQGNAFFGGASTYMETTPICTP